MIALFRSPRTWVLAVIVAAVALVFHQVVFGDGTIGRSSAALVPGYRESGLPVRDPAAGADQDEGWLHAIRGSLASGHLPLVNMSNGMGAPLVESLQPGAFYVLNPVLLLLDPTTPRFFDAFSLLHVVLYVVGLYALLRLYASCGASLAVAILVGLSGVVIENVNMVHFRCHAWFPFVLLGAVRIARGDRSKWPFFLFVFAHVAQITAGAVQEAFVCSLAAGAVFFVEWWWAPAEAGSRARRLARLALAATCSTAIASISFVPYLSTRESGDVLTAAYPERSVEHASASEMSNLVFPQAVGVYPHFFTEGGMPAEWLSDFSTVGVFLVLAGAMALIFAARPTVPGVRARYVAFFVLVALGVAKLVGFFAFDFLQHVPFLSEVLFLKYRNWIFTLAAVLAAAGLDALVTSDVKRTRWIAVGAFAITASLVWWLVSSAWEHPLDELLANLPPNVVHQVWWSYDTSIVAFVAAALLLWFRPRRVLVALVVVAIAHAMFVLPADWFPRAPKYADSVEQRESIDPKLAEPEQMGLRPRLLTRVQPNQNLIAGFEQIGVFDPVCNTHLVELLRAHFHLNHPMFDIQPFTSGEEPLNAQQLEMLRFLGVSRIYGHVIDPAIPLDSTPGGGWLTRFAMPRVWLLSSQDADGIDAKFEMDPIHDVLHSAREAVLPNLAALEVNASAHGYDVRVSRDFQGELVVQQAYAHAWRFEGEIGRVFCGIFPRWTVDLHPGRTYEIRYVPLGFQTSLVISSLGCVLLALSGLFLLRRL